MEDVTKDINVIVDDLENVEKKCEKQTAKLFTMLLLQQ